MSPKHFHFETLDSTQIKAFEFLDLGETPPFVVSADFQESGRGRMERVWHMERGRSLAFTLIVRLCTKNLTGLSLVVGLAIRDFLNRDDIFIKWPNDLMLEGFKVGGVLVESRSQADKFDIAVGVGLNLLDMKQNSYRGIEQKVEPIGLAQKIEEYLKVFAREAFIAFREPYEKWMWGRNKNVVLSVGGADLPLKVKGVSDDGCLITEDQGELRLNTDGEIISQAASRGRP